MPKKKKRNLLLRCTLSPVLKSQGILFLFLAVFFIASVWDVSPVFSAILGSVILVSYFIINIFKVYYDVILYEEGIEALKMIRHLYIPWEDIVQTTTLFGHTTIWTKGLFNLNFPRMAITKSHKDYYGAIEIIEAKVPQKAKRKVKRKNSDDFTQYL